MSGRMHVDKSFWSLLAGQRFLLAIWVLIDHTYCFGPADHGVPFPTKSGYFAVFCFFLISGFSIHHSIAEEPAGYYTRRFWRIVPINVVAVTIGWLAYSAFGLSGDYAVPETVPSVWEWLAYLLLLQGLLPTHISLLQPSWSLNIEAIYYAAAPFLRKLGIGALTLTGITSFAFLCVQPYTNSLPSMLLKPLWAFAFLWVWLGGWLAYMRPFDKSYAAGLVFAGAAYLWLAPAYFDITGAGSAAFNFGAWTLTILTLFFRWNFPRPVWADKAMNYLGDLSFPLYLLHYPILYVLTSTVLKAYPTWNYGVIHVAISLGTAAFALKFLDEPLRTASRRWFLNNGRHSLSQVRLSDQTRGSATL